MSGLIIGPYVVARGSIAPEDLDFEVDDVRQLDGDGRAVVTTVPYVERILNVTVKGTREEIDCIAGYLAYNARFGQNIITIVDGFGVTRSVRVWQNKLPVKHLPGGLASLEVAFREEI
jgi:hypothetical protein